ncbi:hypothetical protein [Microcystis aeruginosa]|uniref:hypothetical protein n=1 Tax=Microcystis aeruginosa TaxID=1126 RepID=UPI003B5183BC
MLPRRRSSQKKNPFSHHPGLLPFAVLSNTDDPEQTIKNILRSEIMRESVIDQDILEEGELSAKLKSIPRLLVLGLTREQIAQALDLEIEQIQQVIEGQT